jgi:hypothetical protein
VHKVTKYSYLGKISKSPLISTTAPAFNILLKLTKVHIWQLLLPEVSYNLRNQDQGTDAWHTHAPNGHTITDSQSNTTTNAIATKHRSPGFCLPPTAIQTKSVINDKDQQTREWVEMDFSITAQIPEMDFSEYKTNKQEEMDFSMTTQEPVERV